MAFMAANPLVGHHLHGEIARGDLAGDLGDVLRLAAELGREADREEHPEEDAGEHAADDEEDHVEPALVVHRRGLLVERLGVLLLVLHDVGDGGVEDLEGGVPGAHRHLHRGPHRLHRVRSRQLLDPPADRQVVVPGPPRPGERCLARLRLDERRRLLEVLEHLPLAVLVALEEPGALLRARGEQVVLLRPDQGGDLDVDVLHVGEADHLPLVHLPRQLAHRRHVLDADEADHRGDPGHQHEHDEQARAHLEAIEPGHHLPSPARRVFPPARPCRDDAARSGPSQ